MEYGYKIVLNYLLLGKIYFNVYTKQVYYVNLCLYYHHIHIVHPLTKDKPEHATETYCCSTRINNDYHYNK